MKNFKCPKCGCSAFEMTTTITTTYYLIGKVHKDKTIDFKLDKNSETEIDENKSKVKCSSCWEYVDDDLIDNVDIVNIAK